MKKNLQSENFNNFVGTPLESRDYIYKIFVFKFTLRYLQTDIVPTVYTGGKFVPGVVTNLPLVPLIPVVHLDMRISPRIFEKFETVLTVYSGAGGKLIHEKN